MFQGGFLKKTNILWSLMGMGRMSFIIHAFEKAAELGLDMVTLPSHMSHAL